MITQQEFQFLISYIRNRRFKFLSREYLKQWNEIIDRQFRLDQRGLVQYFSDCFHSAFLDVCKEQREKHGAPRITSKWKHYQTVASFLELPDTHNISYYEFCRYGVEQRRSHQIPPLLQNICTKKLLGQFLMWKQKNRYRVGSWNTARTAQKVAYKQLETDLATMVTYQLRRQSVLLNSADGFLFSSLTKVILTIQGLVCFELDQSEQLQYEDLQLDTQYLGELKRCWNRLLDFHQTTLESINPSFRDPAYLHTVRDLKTLLVSLKF
jgi:hypothetical protein